MYSKIGTNADMFIKDSIWPAGSAELSGAGQRAQAAPAGTAAAQRVDDPGRIGAREHFGAAAPAVDAALSSDQRRPALALQRPRVGHRLVGRRRRRRRHGRHGPRTGRHRRGRSVLHRPGPPIVSSGTPTPFRFLRRKPITTL